MYSKIHSENTNMSLPRIFYHTTKDFIETTSIGGISTVAARKSRFQKFFWFVFFAGFLGKTALDTKDIIQDFLSWPVLTRVQLASTGSVAFPSVSVCNLNPIDCSRLLQARQESSSDRLDKLWEKSDCSKSIFVQSYKEMQENKQEVKNSNTDQNRPSREPNAGNGTAETNNGPPEAGGSSNPVSRLYTFIGKEKN